MDSNYGNTDYPASNQKYPTTSTESGQSSTAEVKNLKYTSYSYNKSNLDSDIQSILFNGTYWLASRCIRTSSSITHYCTRCVNNETVTTYDMFQRQTSASATATGRYDILPIVTLKPNSINILEATADSGKDGNAWTLK